ncbi:class I SAM-dependent methyltransferase [Pannonibacter sp. Pt2-lr]
MTALLIAEKAPRAAHVLVVGAGGGLEIRALAQAQPDWLFTGVDPSPAMLDIARQTLFDCAERADLIQGTAVDAPQGPFDGAVCLLTLHFLSRDERLQTLREIHSRLKPGASSLPPTTPAPAAKPKPGWPALQPLPQAQLRILTRPQHWPKPWRSVCRCSLRLKKKTVSGTPASRRHPLLRRPVLPRLGHERRRGRLESEGSAKCNYNSSRGGTFLLCLAPDLRLEIEILISCQDEKDAAWL